MKQFEKLQNLLKDPKKYGVKKGTRVYKMLQELAIKGIVRTGYSSRNCKYVDTYDVYNALCTAGISCKHYNNAPRCGACGEHVELTGKVAKDIKTSFSAFRDECEAYEKKEYRYSWNIEQAYIKQYFA